MPTDPSHPLHSPYALALKFDQLSESEALAFYFQLIQCPRCSKAFQELHHWCSVLGHPSPRVAPEYVTRHKLYEDLMLSPKPRLEVILMDSVYHHWGLCTLFLEQSNQALQRDAEYALDLALTALEIAQLLSKDFYSGVLVNDLIGKSHMQVLEAQLQVGKSTEGISLLAKVRAVLREGTGSPRLLAALDHLEGRFLTFVGAKEEALRIFDRGLRASLEALHHPAKSPHVFPFPRHRFSI